MSEAEMTPRPTIEIDSLNANYKERQKEFLKMFPKYSKVDYGKMYYTMKKFRNRQRVLLHTNDIEDPDPFFPTYLFYCFKGKLLD